MGNEKPKAMPDISFKSGTSALSDDTPETGDQNYPAQETDQISGGYIQDGDVGLNFHTDDPLQPEESPQELLKFHTDVGEKNKKSSSVSAEGRNRKKKKKKKKKKRFNLSIVGGLTLTIVIVSASVVLATGAITYGMEYMGINKSENDITFNIPEGADSEDIADILVQNGIINSKSLFMAVLKLNSSPTLYPGDITLSPSMSYPDIIELLSEMRESYATAKITVTEGMTLLEVANLLEENEICTADDFLFQFNSSQDFTLDQMVSPSSDAYYSMEGYFFPDTYEFYVNDSAYNVTKTVRENFYSKLTDDMIERMDELGMDLNEVMILASIVQKEAATVDEMPTVASVFYNRLDDDDTFPNLQSDATYAYVTSVIEVVESSSAMVDYYADCYDTYVCLGLPAGPICNPGLDAIEAVLYPEDTDYYFFVYNSEEDLTYFAETYEEHQEYCKKAGIDG